MSAGNSGDTAWLLTATALVLFMTLPGLAAFYSGLVRSKNVLSVLMQCFAISCIVSVLWLVGGYGLAFGDGGAAQPLIGSISKVWFSGVSRDSLSGTVTPASGFVGPIGGVIIGAIAGVVCFAATQLLKRKFKIDDSLDVSPVHGVGGVVGTLLTGVFVDAGLGGIGYASGMTMGSQVAIQALAVLATTAWCALATFGILKVLDLTLGLRVTEDQEREGLDLCQHGERGYSE